MTQQAKAQQLSNTEKWQDLDVAHHLHPFTDPKDLKTWIHNLPESEKDDILFRLVEAPNLISGQN